MRLQTLFQASSIPKKTWVLVRHRGSPGFLDLCFELGVIQVHHVHLEIRSFLEGAFGEDRVIWRVAMIGMWSERVYTTMESNYPNLFLPNFLLAMSGGYYY